MSGGEGDLEYGTGQHVPVIELDSIPEIENRPVIEILKPNETISILDDIDLSVLDPKEEETPGRVRKKVHILNTSLVKLSLATGKQVLFTWLTQKSKRVFQNDQTKDIYGPLLDVQSVRHGKDSDGNSSLITTPQLHALCEFGTVTSVNDWTKPKGDPEKIITRIDERYLETFRLLKEFQNILAEHILSVGGEQVYQLEDGNLAYVAVQMLGGTPMPMKTKKELAHKIQLVLHELGRKDILDALALVTDYDDLDCTPHALNGLAKSIGVSTEIQSKHEQGYPWFAERDLVIVDDKWHAAGRAAERILSNGGVAITPANGDDELKRLLGAYQGGFVSQYPTFLGVIDGMHWLATGQPMEEKKIRQIEMAINS